LTFGQFAALMGVGSQSTVTNWRNEGMPAYGGQRQGAGGHVVLGEALAWLYEHKTKLRGSTSERDRLTREQWVEKARQNAVAQGELIYSADIRRALEPILAWTNAEFRSLGGRCCADAAASDSQAEVQSIIDGHAASALERIAGKVRELGESLGADAAVQRTVEAATGEDAGSVGGSEPDTAVNGADTGALAQ